MFNFFAGLLVGVILVVLFFYFRESFGDDEGRLC